MTNEPSPTCRRCGKCCLAYFTAYVTDIDMARWKQEKRQDILNIVDQGKVFWAGDHLVSAGDGHYVQGCCFFSLENGLGRCGIYGTRPQVCRDYEPGSSDLCPQHPQS